MSWYQPLRWTGRSVVALLLLLAGVSAPAAAAPGAAPAFARALGYDRPAPTCTATSGCLGGIGGSGAGALDDPTGVVVSNGEIYVADRNNQRIAVFSEATRGFVRAFGSGVGGPGVGTCTQPCQGGDGDQVAGSLNSPRGGAISGGEFYVADQSNHRISVFTAATGAFVRTFGKNVGGPGVDVCTTLCNSGDQGNSAGAMDYPTGVAVLGGEVFVSDLNNHRVSVFTTAGVFERAFGKDVGGAGVGTCTVSCSTGTPTGAAGGLNAPYAIAAAGSDVYLADLGNNRVTEFTTAGVFERAFGKNVGGAGVDVCTVSCAAGAAGGAPAALPGPYGLAVVGSELFVTDQGNNRVSAFTTAGAFERAFGKDVGGAGVDTCTTSCASGSVLADQPGALDTPGPMAASNGHLFVPDQHNDRVSVFAVATGAFEDSFGLAYGQTCTATTGCLTGLGTDRAGGFTAPTDVTESSGELFVADQQNQRIDVFSATTGAFSRALGADVGGSGVNTCTTSCVAGTPGSAAGQLGYPEWVAVSDGELFVSEVDNSRISVFSASSGAFARAFGKDVGGAGVDVCTTSCDQGTSSADAGAFAAPRGLAVAQGHVFVADSDAQRVSEFSTAGAFLRAFGKDVGGAGVDVCTTTCGQGEYSSAAGAVINPQGLAVSGGEVYVADQANDRVSVFSATTGAFVRAVGASGSAAGELVGPTDVAVDGGEVFVSEAANNRISVFSPAGVFSRAFGSGVGGVATDVCTTTCGAGNGGTVAGTIDAPLGLAVGGGQAYAISSANNRVDAFVLDTLAPISSDDVPGGYRGAPVSVALSAADTGGSSVASLHYTTGANPALPTTASAVYDAGHKPVLQDGERIRYFATDLLGNAEAPHTSAAARVDLVAPATSDDVPSAEQTAPVPVSLAASDSGGSGVAGTFFTVGQSPAPPTTASAVYDPAHKPTLGDGERIRYFSTDLVGNAEAPHTSTAVRLATTPSPGGGTQPDNRFTSGRPAIAPGGGLVLRYGLPGAGRLEVILHHNRRPRPTPRRLLPGPGRVVLGRAERDAARAGRQRLVIPLSGYGLRMIRRNGGHLRVVITEQFTPVGGTARTRSRTVRLRMRHGGPSAITIAGVSGGA